jgi:Fe2+ transport system protein FeoA
MNRREVYQLPKYHSFPEQCMLQCVTDIEGLLPLDRICEGCSCTVVGLAPNSPMPPKASRLSDPSHGRGRILRHRHGKKLWRHRRGIGRQHRLAHRLSELGFCNSAKVRVVVSRKPGPILVEVRGSRLALDAQVAGQILVRPDYFIER